MRTGNTKLQELVGQQSPESKDSGQTNCYGNCCAGQLILDDTFVDEKQKAGHIDKLLPRSQHFSNQPPIVVVPRALEDLQNDRLAVSEEELVIMSHRVFGFTLRNRNWGKRTDDNHSPQWQKPLLIYLTPAKMDLDHLSELYESPDINADPEKDNRLGTGKDPTLQVATFDHLVLQKGHHDMMVSLITQYFRHKRASTTHRGQFDIVRGKGGHLPRTRKKQQC